MKKTIIALTAVATVALSSASVAYAETLPPTPSTSTSAVASPAEVPSVETGSPTQAEAEPGSFTPNDPAGQGSSDDSVIIAASVIGSLSLIAAVAGGAAWAIYERIIPNPLPGIIPAKWVAPETVDVWAPVQQAVAPVQRPAPYYANCTAVWDAVERPLRSTDVGYRAGLDNDGDGIACELDPR